MDEGPQQGQRKWGADRLAAEGANKDTPDVVNLDRPAMSELSGM